MYPAVSLFLLFFPPELRRRCLDDVHFLFFFLLPAGDVKEIKRTFRPSPPFFFSAGRVRQGQQGPPFLLFRA